MRANLVCGTDKAKIQDQYRLRRRKQTNVKWAGHAVKAGKLVLAGQLPAEKRLFHRLRN